MYYQDVCFRINRYYEKPNVMFISSLLTEFAIPADWPVDGFQNVEEIISYTKEYIEAIMGFNCFDSIIREDAVIVMDRGAVLEIYYGFTPITQVYNDALDISIEEKSLELLTYYNYGKVNSEEIDAEIPMIIEAFSCDARKYKLEYIIKMANELRIGIDACGEDLIELFVSIAITDTISDVVKKVKSEMRNYLSDINLPYAVSKEEEK